jgi:uncharacterized protein YlaI
MPQAKERTSLSFVRHLLCPSCLNPMRIRTAEIAPDGREEIQFICNSCESRTVSKTRGD